MENSTIVNGNTIQSIQNLVTENSVSNILLQTYCNVVQAIPIIDLSGIAFVAADQHVITDIVNHQNDAIAATKEVSTALSEMESNLSDVIGFANMWNSRYESILTLLDSEESNSNQQLLTAGIQGLINECNTIGKNSTNAIITLNNFIAGINNVLTYLKSDQVIIEKYFGGDTGAIENLEAQINSLNATMESDNATISRGALKQGLGVLIITIVVVAEIFKNSNNEGGGEESGGNDDDDDESGKIINASVDMIKDDIKQQSAASDQWNSSFVAYQSLVVNLTSEKQLYAATVQLCNSMASIFNTATAVITIETDLQEAWNTLDLQLQGMINSIQDNTINIQQVKTTLIDMNSDINALKAGVISLQSQGTVQVVS